MKLELQGKLLERYPKFFRKPGRRLVLAACPPAIPMDFISPSGVERFELRVKSDHLEDTVEDDASVFDYRGIECDDGWYQIVDRLVRTFENAIEIMIREGVPKERWPRMAQVKEKFGILRVYVHVTGPMPSDLDAALREAAEASAHTCESCGQPGQLRKGGWVHVYCDTCEARYLERKGRPFDAHTCPDFEGHARDLRALLDGRSE